MESLSLRAQPRPQLSAARCSLPASRPACSARPARRVAAHALSLSAAGGGGGVFGGSGSGGGGRGDDGASGSGDQPRRRILNWTTLSLVLATYFAEKQQAHNEAAHGTAPPPPTQNDAGAQLLASLSPTELSQRAPRRVALFVEPSPFTYVSGYNTRFRNTIAQLVAQGAQVLVVTTGAGRSLPGVDFYAGVDPPSEFAGARVLGAPSFGCPLYWSVPLSFGASPRVWKELSDFKPDLIHVTTPGVMCIAAWAYSRLLDVPLFASYHTHLPNYLKSYGLGFLKPAVWAAIRAVHSKAHFSIAASDSLAQELVAERASPPHRTSSWRKAVDEELFNPKHRDEATRLTLAGGDAAQAKLPMLLYVGRLGAEKSVDSLVPMLRALPNAHLAVVGDGPERAELEARFASDPKTASRVTFLGTLRGADLSTAYASSDVFLMPSETETLGFVVLEAMASGLPVVAARAGGVPDIITRPNENGFLYPPGDGEAAAAAVRRLLRDAALRARVGAAAREEAAGWGWAAATRALREQQYASACVLHGEGLFRRGSTTKRAEGGEGGRKRFALAAAAKMGAKAGLQAVAGRSSRRAGRAGVAGRALVRSLKASRQ